ncbi:MAG: hypothetical protein JWO57_2906, partial [Pseudonocardiales bacterium]|nr:hypothetical protein [Pseudonocardiales bacterium]
LDGRVSEPPGQYPPPYGEPLYPPQPGPPAIYGYWQPPAQWGAPPGYPLPPGRRRSEPVVGWLLLFTAMLTIVAALLPWATAFTISISGTTGDGNLTIFCAIVIAVAGLVIGLGEGRLWAAIVALIFSLFVLLIGFVDAADISRILNRYGGVGSIGAGLWLTVLAGALGVVLSIVAIARRPMRR